MHDQQNIKKFTNIPKFASYVFLIQNVLEKVSNFSTKHINGTILCPKNDDMRKKEADESDMFHISCINQIIKFIKKTPKKCNSVLWM